MRDAEKPADEGTTPRRGDGRLEVLLPPHLKERVIAHARAERLSAAVVARLAIEAWLDRKEARTAA